MINFFAATEKHVGAEAGPVQNPAGFHDENITNFKRPNFDSGRHENPLEENHWEPLKRPVFKSSKEVLWIDFARKMYSGSVLKVKKIYDSLQTVWTGADDVLRPQTDVRDEVGESGKSRM